MTDGPATGTPRSKTTGAPPATTAPPRIPGVAGPAGGSDAASDLKADPECGLGNEAVTHLSWRPATTRGSSQVVVVTAFANGFETGNYQSSPALGPGAAAFDWTDTTANSAYRWRVMTKHGQTWAPSEISSFIGPSCGVEDTG